MEWVEVTAKTIEAAKELALDKLGVAPEDAEFEVLEEPKAGLFGRTRGEARVKARVRPTAVRPKRDRRDRGRTRGERADQTTDGDDAGSRETVAATTVASAGDTDGGVATRERGERRDGRRRRSGGSREGAEQKESNVEPNPDINPEEVGAAAAAFMTGLAEALGSPASAQVVVDGSELEIRLEGDDLGLLIGPGGRTLTAVQDLARVAAQRKLGDHETRLKIDVAGYREKRREALEKFARTVAAEVVASGRAKALEPMSSADRKVVHDAINDYDGVTSRSDGEEPARRVVIAPA